MLAGAHAFPRALSGIPWHGGCAHFGAPGLAKSCGLNPLTDLTDFEKLRKRLGENARAWITELCSWDKVIAETIETYEQALQSDA